MTMSMKANAAGTQAEILLNGTTVQTLTQNWCILPMLNYANDAAAAAGGVPIGGLYHTAGAVRVRIV